MVDGIRGYIDSFGAWMLKYAMAAPTTVSALVYSSTFVTAGRIIALSALSQLGLIMRTIGLDYLLLIRFFHSLTRALLRLYYLCAGIIIHCLNDLQDFHAIDRIFITKRAHPGRAAPAGEARRNVPSQDGAGLQRPLQLAAYHTTDSGRLRGAAGGKAPTCTRARGRQTALHFAAESGNWRRVRALRAAGNYVATSRH
ncbi:NADH-ubiquinone oxidoreductase chain 5 [Gryllus bimaculatus]|nr:NADH-ubiquinone oxidoreductase chain 5 [Gryllus bimaculatus]